jgi:hypothetical protein
MIGRSQRALFLVLLLVLGASPLPAQAQDEFAAPRPLTSPLPPQPTNARGVPVEGWVTIRYSVLANGTPSNVRAVNFMPPSIDPAPTIATVSQWTFSPGLRDGQPIDWHNTETVVTFRSQGGTGDDPAAFEQSYAAIAALIEADPVANAAAALEANQSLLNESTTRLAELGLGLVQNAIIHVGRDDLLAALEPMRMATDPRVPILSGTELFPALQLRMQIERELGRVGEARASHARLAKGLGQTDVDPVFVQIGEELKTLAETAESSSK